MVTETQAPAPSTEHPNQPSVERLRHGRQWCDGCGDQVEINMLMGWNGLRCCGGKHLIVHPHDKIKETCFSCLLKHKVEVEEKKNRC